MNPFPFIDAAEYFLSLKQADGAAVPVAENGDEGLLHAMAEAARSKLGLAIAYRVYSESLRDPSASAVSEHFKEHSEDCLNDVDFFVRRSSVMTGGVTLDGVEAPPPAGDLTEIIGVLTSMEEANLHLMGELLALLDGNPAKYEVEAMMAKDQHHLDDLVQHTPAAPELPSVEEATPAAAAPAVVEPAKVAGVSASKGLARVGELLTGSRAKKLTKASDKALTAANDHLSKAEGHARTMREALGKNLVHTARKAREAEEASFNAGQRTLSRSRALDAGAEAEGSKVFRARAAAGTAAVGTAGGTGALLHGRKAKSNDGTPAQNDSEVKTSEMGAAAMGRHPQVSPPPPLSGAAAGQHPKLAAGMRDRARQLWSGEKAHYLGLRAKHLASQHERLDPDIVDPEFLARSAKGVKDATRDHFVEEAKVYGTRGAAMTGAVGAATGLAAGARAVVSPREEKTAQRTYDMSGSKRDGRAYSMHTTPDDYELSTLINSKMDGDLRGVRGKAKNEGALVGSGLGAVKGLKAGKGWGGGQVIRTGGGGGTVIGTFGSGGSGLPKGTMAAVRENQGMIRDELRGQGIKVGSAFLNYSDEDLRHLSDRGSNAVRYAFPVGGAVIGALSGGKTLGGKALGVALGGGLGALVGGAANNEIRQQARTEEINRAMLQRARQTQAGVPGGTTAAGLASNESTQAKVSADKSDSELAEAGRQRAIANLASGFTSDKHTSGERHGTLVGRLGGAALGAGAGTLASRGATLPVRLAAGMGGAVIGGSMGGQIGKTIGSNHDAARFWEGHKEAAGGLAGVGEKAVAALGRLGITHSGQLGSTLTHAAVGALPGAVIGAVGGATAAGEGHRLRGALTGGALGGAAGAAVGVGGKKFLTKALDRSNTVRDPFGPLSGPIRPGTGSLDHVVPHAPPAASTPTLHAPDLSHFAPQGAAPIAHGAPIGAVPAGPRRPAVATDFHVPEAASAPEPTPSLSLAPPDVSKFTKPRWKIAQAKQAGLVDSARSLFSRVTSRPTVSSVGKTLASAEHSGESIARKAMAATAVPTHVPVPTTGTLPSAVSHFHAPSSGSTLDLDLHHMAQEKKFHDAQPSWARKAITESKYVRPSGSAPDLPTPSSAGRMSPEVATALARASKLPGETTAQAMVRLSKVAAAMRQLGYSSSGSSVVHGEKEMDPRLGKRKIRDAKQIWNKVKEAMDAAQYLQIEGAGQQAQAQAEADYLHDQLQQTSQQLEEASAQSQAQAQQLEELQGTVEQMKAQQAEQAQAADAAVETARQTAEAAMSQSMQRSAELMKQIQVAAQLQNAQQTLKEQLAALSNMPSPPATVSEAGAVESAAQGEVGAQAAEAEAAAAAQQEQEAMAAQGQQSAPPAQTPAAPPKVASLGDTAGKILSKAPHGTLGAVIGAGVGAGTGLLQKQEHAFLQDAVQKLEQRDRGGFATGMALAKARMWADQSQVAGAHPVKATLYRAGKGAIAGFGVERSVRSLLGGKGGQA